MTEKLQAGLIEAQKRYVEGIEPLEKVAKATGIARNTVCYHARKERWMEKRRIYREAHGLPPFRASSAFGSRRFDTIGAEMAYITTNASLAQLAEALGVSEKTIQNESGINKWGELRKRYRAELAEGLQRRAAGEDAPGEAAFSIPNAVMNCFKGTDGIEDRETAELCVRYITGRETLKQLSAETGVQFNRLHSKCTQGRWSHLRQLYRNAIIEPLTKAAVASAVDRIARAGEINAQLMEDIARRIPEARDLRDCLNGFLCIEKAITNEMLVRGKMTPYDTARIDVMKEQLKLDEKALQLKQQPDSEKQIVEVVWPDAQMRAWGE